MLILKNDVFPNFPEIGRFLYEAALAHFNSRGLTGLIVHYSASCLSVTSECSIDMTAVVCLA